MMKRIIFAFLFFLIVIAAAAAELGYVTANADLYISKIELTDKQVYKNNFEDALNMCDKLENSWNDSSKKIDVMLNHDCIDSIGESINRMTSYIQNGSIDMYFAESSKAKKELASIKESEYPFIENIL